VKALQNHNPQQRSAAGYKAERHARESLFGFFGLRATSAQASTHAPPSVWCHRTCDQEKKQR
ncbi:unnamed protein product, partial [Ectocarpus sp. 12 AP-2014]